MHYLLEGHKPIEIEVWKNGVMDKEALFKWANWFETANRHIAHTEFKKGFVSTIFLGLDPGPWFSKNKRPLLFETMAFEVPGLGYYQKRYATWDEAEKGHKAAVKEISKFIKNGQKNG